MMYTKISDNTSRDGTTLHSGHTDIHFSCRWKKRSSHLEVTVVLSIACFRLLYYSSAEDVFPNGGARHERCASRKQISGRLFVRHQRENMGSILLGLDPFEVFVSRRAFQILI